MKKVLIAGGSGLVGQALIKHFPEDSYHIHILSRSKRANTSKVSYFQWDLDKEEIDLAALKVDVIINLTGAGIADKRWSKSRKEVLIQSRTKSATLIAKGLEQSTAPTRREAETGNAETLEPGRVSKHGQ